MRLIVLFAAMAFGLAACSDMEPSKSARVLGVSTSDAATAARMISQYRSERGLPPVTVNATLNDAAVMQAKAVAAAGKLSHGNFSARMYQFKIRGAAAENLAAGSDTIAEAIARWKKSPGHNENMLMPEARQIGLARVTTASGYRTYWALVLAASQTDRDDPGFIW